MTRFAKYFPEAEVSAKGHGKGIISDGPPYDKPADSVRRAVNMNFNKIGYDEMRRPISLLAGLSSVIPSGYEIDTFKSKVFTDFAGTKKECLVVGVRKTGSPYKIYINNWFNATTDYQNSDGGTTGWRVEWVELTETYTRDMNTVTYGLNNYTAYITVPTLNKSANYFRGWYVRTTDDNVIDGVITASVNVGSSTKLTVMIQTNINDAGATPFGAGDCIISRYPVTSLLSTLFDNVDTAEFTEENNGIVIATGHNARPILLQFLPRKKFFGAAADVTQLYDVSTPITWKRNYDGFWIDYDMPNNNGITTFIEVTDTSSHYTFLNEAGIDLEILSANLTASDPDYLKTQRWAILIEYDGFQSILLKNIRLPITGSDIRAANLALYYRVDFSKRVSASLIFYDRNDDNIIDNPFLLPQSLNGRRVIDTTATTGAPGISNNGFYYNQVDETAIYNKEQINFGVSLNTYLNHDWTAKTGLKCKKFVRLGDNLLAVNLALDSFTFDTANQNTGMNSAAALSQWQNLTVKALNVYSDTRFKIPFREDITAAEVIDIRSIAFFTKNSLVIYRLTDDLNFDLQLQFEYNCPGPYNFRNTVAAQTDNYFGGIFWVSEAGLQRFYNNQHDDKFLFGRWLEEFLALSEEQKRNIRLGFYPLEKQVWIFIDAGNIWIYDIALNNFSKYDFDNLSGTASDFAINSTNDILFANDQEIYKMENSETLFFKDLQNPTDYLNTGTAIVCGYDFAFNINSNLENFVPHKIKLYTEQEIVSNLLVYILDVTSSPSGTSYTASNKHLVIDLNRPAGFFQNPYFTRFTSDWVGAAVILRDHSGPGEPVTYSDVIASVIDDKTAVLTAGTAPDIANGNLSTFIQKQLTFAPSSITISTSGVNLNRTVTIKNGPMITEKKFKRDQRKHLSYQVVSIFSNVFVHVRKFKIMEYVYTVKKGANRKPLKTK